MMKIICEDYVVCLDNISDDDHATDIDNDCLECGYPSSIHIQDKKTVTQRTLREWVTNKYARNFKKGRTEKLKKTVSENKVKTSP